MNPRRKKRSGSTGDRGRDCERRFLSLVELPLSSPQSNATLCIRSAGVWVVDPQLIATGLAYAGRADSAGLTSWYAKSGACYSRAPVSVPFR